MRRWTVTLNGNHMWEAKHGGRLYATLAVIVQLEHESAVMARIAEGLNREHEDTPDRTWTAQPVPDSYVSWDLRHNGRDCIGIIWHTDHPGIPTGMERVLAGLNCQQSRALPAAEPAKPRHLRLVS